MNTNIISLAQQIQHFFPTFYLAGGTAIMIKYNNRVSYVLDFFSYKAFSFNRLAQKITALFKNNIERWERLENNIDFFIDSIKVSFVFFPFKNLERTERVSGIIVASDIDLFLNKIYVAERRIDPKDPFDAAYLYIKHQWTKEHIQNCFETKFPGQSYKIYLGALCSFDDYSDLPNWVKETLRDLIDPA